MRPARWPTASPSAGVRPTFYDHLPRGRYYAAARLPGLAILGRSRRQSRHRPSPHPGRQLPQLSAPSAIASADRRSRAPARRTALGLADRPLCSLAYLLSGYRRSAVSCSQLAALNASGHLRRAAAVRLIVVSAWMPLSSSPIQTLMPASEEVCIPALI